MIRGTVAVRLALVDPDGHLEQAAADRRALSPLYDCPAGVHVVVDIGARKWVSHAVADVLHQLDQRLDIEIVGEDVSAVGFLIQAARSGCWGPI